MDVEDARRIGLEQRLADEPHEAGQADEIDAPPPQLVDDRAIVPVAVRVALRIEMERLDAGFARTLQSGGRRTVRDDDGNRRLEAPLANRIDDRLQVRSAAGNEHTEPGDHEYDTTRGPGTTVPIRRADSPRCSRAVSTSDSCSGAQTTIRPMPMLNARNISSRATRPRCCRSVKIAGGSHARVSMDAPQPSGRMRGRLSVIPPPVMCASPLTHARSKSGSIDRRYERFGASSASPTVASSSGTNVSTRHPSVSN